jgi:tripartite-type tricarboxylate transporter receptor subunit TctC
MVVSSNSPYKTLASLIRRREASSGKLNYGSGSPGGFTGLAAEAFKQAAALT